MISLKFLLLFLCIISVASSTPSPDAETRLLKDLDNRTSNLHKFSSPTHDGPVRAELLFELMSFNFKDEAYGLTNIQAFVSAFWKDIRLAWNPEDYEGIEFVTFPVHNVWLPDITLISSGRIIRHIVPNADISSSGNVSLYDNYIIESTCQLNLRYFPYDKQVCTLSFGSWSRGAKKLKLTPIAKDKRYFFYQEGSDFKITKLDAGAHDLSTQFGYVNVDFNVHLERISSAYSVKLILPAVVTGFLILLTFLLPPTSHGKITLAGLVFVSLILQIVNLQNIVPGSGRTRIGDFLAFAICMDFVAFVVAVLAYYLHDKMHKRQPPNSIFRYGRLQSVTTDENGTSVEMLPPVDVVESNDALPLPQKCHGVIKILRYLDIICFVIFLIVYILGIAVIFG